MLYIQKTHPSQELWDFIKIERDRGNIKPKYDEIPSTPINIKQLLREQLYIEQRGICCYCMQVLENANSHTNIEHFLPDSLFPENRVDYYNLYLACQHSKGKGKGETYCDVAKGNNLIPKLLGYYEEEKNKEGNIIIVKCEDLIQYDDNGYILPYHDTLKNYSEFYRDRNFEKLNGKQKQIMGMIEILNLNHLDLKSQRKNFIDMWLPQINTSDITKLQKMIDDFYIGQKKKFAGLGIYFLKKRIKILQRK